MKPYQIIDNYCRLYGVTMPEIDYSETRFFVAISSGGAQVMYLREPSKLLGRIVCEALKRGTVLHVHNGWVQPLLWEHWNQTWKRLFAPKTPRSKAPSPDFTRPYKSEIFETMQQPRRPKKPFKHGFERTFAANQSMNLLTGSLPGMQIETL